ncbi:MAG: ABC transporter permease [Bdellovibrionota bacterium]
MFSKSLVEMVKGRVREFKREPSAMFFVVLMPIIWMSILGAAFSGNRNEVFSIALFSSDLKQESNNSLYQFLKDDPQLQILIGEANEHSSWLKGGKVSVIVKLDMAAKQVEYHYDPNNPMSSKARMQVNDKIQKFAGRSEVVKSKDDTVIITGSRYIDFLIPGLLALTILTSSLFGTGMTIVVNRRDNLLKQYLTTPMNPYEYIISHIIGRFIILIVEFAAIMVFGIVVFDFQMQGRWLDYILISILGSAVFAAIGILAGARSNNASAYNGKTNLIALPMMMLSGVWYSRAGFPNWLAQIIDYLPLTPLVDSLRKIALEGVSILRLGPEIAVLIVYLVVATIFAKRRFVWF